MTRNDSTRGRTTKRMKKKEKKDDEDDETSATLFDGKGARGNGIHQFISVGFDGPAYLYVNRLCALICDPQPYEP